MNKKTKTIIGSVIILIIIAAVIIAVKVNVSKNDKNKAAETTVVEQNQSVSDNQTKSGDDNYVTIQPETEAVNKSTTNYFDNIDVVEETTKKKNKRNKKDKESEAYPGENDGWSPLVSPDDLEQ
ncbi:MAG: hypothetical protein HFG31_00520 [Eubacterium sp.]|nr:hypothetical protein [Eubacterium sp.]